jgi:capsular polysaccharide biosynthesis protein
MSRFPVGATALALGAAAGIALGLVVGLLRSPGYDATATVVVAPHRPSTDRSIPTIARTAAGLVRTPTVAENVASALHLAQSPESLLHDIDAHARTGTALVDITVHQSTAIDAERVAQQVLVVFESLATARLGAGEVVTWQAPSGDARRASRHVAAYAVAGGSLGLLAGAAGALLLRRRREHPWEVAMPEPEPEPEPVPEPQPEPEPEPEPDPEPAGDRGLVAELARRAAAETDPARQAELAAYLTQFRGFADPDGNLPPNFLALVEEVFGPVSA